MKYIATLVAVVASAACPLLASAATYSTGLVTNSVVGVGGTIVNTPGVGSTFTSTNGTVVTFSNIPALTSLTPNSILNIGNLSINTGPTATDTFTINYTDTLTLTDGSNAPFTIIGSLALTNIHRSGGDILGTITNTYSSPFTRGPATLNGTPYTVLLGTGAANDFFTAPNPAGTGGRLGALVTTPSPVPLPAALPSATLLLLGVGIAAKLRSNKKAEPVA